MYFAILKNIFVLKQQINKNTQRNASTAKCPSKTTHNAAFVQTDITSKAKLKRASCAARARFQAPTSKAANIAPSGTTLWGPWPSVGRVWKFKSWRMECVSIVPTGRCRTRSKPNAVFYSSSFFASFSFFRIFSLLIAFGLFSVFWLAYPIDKTKKVSAKKKWPWWYWLLIALGILLLLLLFLLLIKLCTRKVSKKDKPKLNEKNESEDMDVDFFDLDDDVRVDNVDIVMDEDQWWLLYCK